MPRLQLTSPEHNSPALIDQGRQLAESLRSSAMNLGYSKAHEFSNEIPALIFWAAQVSRRICAAEDERHLAHEASLRYYKNYESTAWLWDAYIQDER